LLLMLMRRKISNSQCKLTSGFQKNKKLINEKKTYYKRNGVEFKCITIKNKQHHLLHLIHALRIAVGIMALERIGD